MADGYAYPPRGLQREAAARYVGVDIARFDRLVAGGQVPSPQAILGVEVWDRLALDQAFDSLGGREATKPLKDHAQLAMRADGHPNVYTPENLAKRWSCSAAHVRQMIRRGQIEGWLLGGKLMRITVDAVKEFELANREPGAPRLADDRS